MEITGKIIAVLPERSGTSTRTGSEWRVATYVLETMDQYPRKLAFEVFGTDRIQQFAIQLGEIMTVSFDIDAREFKDRWYNTIRAFRVDRNVTNPSTASVPPPSIDPFATSAPSASSQQSSVPTDVPMMTSTEDDLPF